MNTKDLLIRARMHIQRKNSFFAYLSLYLKFKEDKTLPDWAGAGVDEQGNFYYKEEFISKLTSEEVEGVVTHEILHIVLLHLLRRKSREQKLWNLACDVVVNQILKENNFKLPYGCISSNYENEVDIGGIKIKNCNKKTAEQIYDELYKEVKKQQGKGKKKQGKEKEDNKGRFDVHFEEGTNPNKKNKGKKLTPSEKKELEKLWNGRTQEALTFSKMKGDIPKGMERLIGELHKEKINWKALLNQYIINQIPYNYSYRRPHKKSIAIGEYMPDMLKEKIDIVIGIDVSGSIGKKELTDFLSEIIGIARAFQEKINMRLITHECEVLNDYEIRNGNIEKIKNLEIKGGGGTAHTPIFDYIKTKIPDCKCSIFLTDGYSDINEIDFNKYSFNKLFVLSESGIDNQLKDKRCMTINLKGL